MKTTTSDTRALLQRNRELVEDFLVRRAKPYSRTVRVDHRLMIRVFLATGKYSSTARECGIRTERVRQIMHTAMRYLRSIGKAPPLSELPDQTKR